MQVHTNETILMEAFKKGDPAAEAEVFRLVYKPFCLMAGEMVHQSQAAEDIVSEILVKLYNRRSEFAALANFKAFGYVALRNACLNYRETNQKQHLRQQQFLDINNNMEWEQLDGALQNEILLAEVIHTIYEGIEELPEKCRQIIKMIFLQGMSTDAIARQLQINPQTVRSQKARGLQLLRENTWKKPGISALSLVVLMHLFVVE
jgi:RNA polymerase sigma-70 factor (family 1)